MDRIGRQDPTISVILPYKNTKGAEAVALYNATERDALDWQVSLCYDIMAVSDAKQGAKNGGCYNILADSKKNAIMA